MSKTVENLLEKIDFPSRKIKPPQYEPSGSPGDIIQSDLLELSPDFSMLQIRPAEELLFKTMLAKRAPTLVPEIVQALAREGLTVDKALSNLEKNLTGLYKTNLVGAFQAPKLFEQTKGNIEAILAEVPSKGGASVAL